MNSICGVWMREGGAPDGLDSVLRALPGRESDIRGTWIDGAVGLAWRGEATVEDDPAERPLHDDGASGLAVAASARLDDRDTLCGASTSPHLQRTGRPDAALIAASYARWGRECPDRLLGDYAFAVWDGRRRRLFCARDAIGVRPFYYCLTAERFVFASDLDAVLAAPGVPGDLDEPALATRLTEGWRPLGPRTFFKAVRKLPPGHSLVVEDGAARVVRWWRPEEAPEAPASSDEALAKAFLDLYKRAVADRVRGAGPVGVHLSGGLDSSSVAVLAARALRRDGCSAPPAFSWHPPPGNGPRTRAEAAEYGLVEAVSQQEGLAVFYCSPSARDALAFLRRDGTRNPQKDQHEELVQRAAAALGVKVLLSGCGGDEGISFNGQGLYPQLLRAGRLGTLWRELRERYRRPFAAGLTEAALPLVSPGAARALMRLRRGLRPWRSHTFINPEFARRVRPLPAPPLEPTGVRRMQHHLLAFGHLAERMEDWAASGALYGIEYRYPLLDRRVLEFALGLPPEQFRRGRWGRWLMRQALASLLPAGVRWNPVDRDPVRSDALRSAYTDALPAVREILDGYAKPPSRSRYLDMPRLMAHLTMDHSRIGTGLWPVRNALRLLDF